MTAQELHGANDVKLLIAATISMPELSLLVDLLNFLLFYIVSISCPSF